MEYEAYETQALVEMKKICGLIREKWSVHGIAILHRIGLVISVMYENNYKMIKNCELNLVIYCIKIIIKSRADLD